MNNEIKEILDKLKFVIDNPTLEDEVGDEQVAIINYTELNAEESKQLLDYITNLREENEDLREENKEAHDFDETMKDIKDNLIARINRQECEIHNLKAKLEMYENGVYFSSENDKLQERIDKAIEYVKSKKAIINTDYIRIFDLFEIDEQGYTDELLKILQGSDK